MSNLRFNNALARIPQNIPPVWMMRQAGRYHQHYQNLRKNNSFMDLCKNPKLAAEVALGPVNDFDFDVAILFSDLLFPLEALGMGLEYTEKGPKLGFQLTPETVHKLRPWQDAIGGLAFQKEAMKETRMRLPQDKSLIGFVGGPWTLFVYAVEGGHQGNLIQSKNDLNLWEQFLKILMPLLKENIQIQLDGGAEIVMIFDTAAGELSPFQFRHFTEGPLLELAHQFPKKLGYYSKGTQSTHLSHEFMNANWAGFGLDHRWDFSEVLPRWHHGFVQGNFDQALLHQAPSKFEKLLREFLTPFQNLSPEKRNGWICGLGHGVLPATPEANVRTFVQVVREVMT